MQQRNTEIIRLAQSYGYQVHLTNSNIEISLNKKNIFIYNPSSNTWFSCVNKYSKQLDAERYLPYIKACLKKSAITDRYSVDLRSKKYCVYDDITKSKVDTFFSYKEAADAAQRLNQLWKQGIEEGGEI